MRQKKSHKNNCNLCIFLVFKTFFYSILFHINVVIIAQHFPTVLIAEKSDSSRNMSSQTKVMHFKKKSHTFEEKKAQMLGKTVAAGLHVFSFTVYRRFAADSPCAISSCRKKNLRIFIASKLAG